MITRIRLPIASQDVRFLTTTTTIHLIDDADERHISFVDATIRIQRFSPKIFRGYRSFTTLPHVITRAQAPFISRLRGIAFSRAEARDALHTLFLYRWAKREAARLTMPPSRLKSAALDEPPH